MRNKGYAYWFEDRYPVLWDGRVSVWTRGDKLAHWKIFFSGTVYILQIHWPSKYVDTTEERLITRRMSAVVREAVDLLPTLVEEWKKRN